MHTMYTYSTRYDHDVHWNCLKFVLYCSRLCHTCRCITREIQYQYFMADGYRELLQKLQFRQLIVCELLTEPIKRILHPQKSFLFNTKWGWNLDSEKVFKHHPKCAMGKLNLTDVPEAVICASMSRYKDVASICRWPQSLSPTHVLPVSGKRKRNIIMPYT